MIFDFVTFVFFFLQKLKSVRKIVVIIFSFLYRKVVKLIFQIFHFPAKFLHMNDIGSKLSAFRKKSIAEKASKKEKRIINLQKNIQKTMQEENSYLHSVILDLQEQIKFLKQNEDNTKNAILKDLIHHVSEKNAKYSSELMSLAIELKTISNKAYQLLEQKLPFPSSRLVDETVNEIVIDLPKQLTELEGANTMIDIYKSKKDYKKLNACLAVDALYFTPEVKFTAEGEITGLLINDSSRSIAKTAFSLFAEDPNKMKNYLSINGDKLIRSGFVFQVQPYDVQYKPFVVHIFPTVNGKANETIVDKLHKIRDILKNRNIVIRSYAFDGDSAYKELHNIYYESYISKAIAEHKINFDRTRKFRVVSDFLHLIKRLRYRLLSAIIHAGFSVDEGIINVDELKLLFGLPDIVWNDEYYTKMHDKLPLKIFSIENFVRLMEVKKYHAAAFWFPISMSLFAINSPNLGYEIRKHFLEAAFWFLVFYKESLDNQKDITLKQKKYKDKIDVLFYSNDLLVEFTNTLHCHLQLMEIIPKFSFDRNSTTPLEHKFGQARVRVHEVHTLGKFLKTISIMETCDRVARFGSLEKFDQNFKIKGRSNSFGVTVEDKPPEEEQQDFHYTPQAFARAMLFYGNFPIDYSALFDPSDIINFELSILQDFVDEIIKRKKRKQSVSSYDATLGIQDLSHAHRRILAEKGVITKKQKYNFIHEFCEANFGPNYNKKHLHFLFDQIADEIDASFPFPSRKAQKAKLIDFLANNLYNLQPVMLKLEKEGKLSI